MGVRNFRKRVEVENSFADHVADHRVGCVVRSVHTTKI